MTDDTWTEAEYLESFETPEDREVPPYFADRSKPRRDGPKGQARYRCTACGQYKPKTDFYADRRVPCGIRSKCKKCYHKKTEATK